MRARSRRRSRSCGSRRDAACRQLARVAVRSRAARSASPAIRRTSRRPKPGLGVGGGDRHRLGDRPDGVVQPDAGVPDRVPERVGDGGDLGPARRARGRGRGHRWAASSRRPRLPTATSATPSVPVRGGRRHRGAASCGGVPPTASAHQPGEPGVERLHPLVHGSGRAGPRGPARLPLRNGVGRGGGRSRHPGRRSAQCWSDQSASSPRSPVRTRTTSSTGSPRPCRRRSGRSEAASTIDVHDAARRRASSTRTSMRTFGHEVHGVLRAAVDLGVAPLAAEALDLADRHARRCR